MKIKLNGYPSSKLIDTSAFANWTWKKLGFFSSLTEWLLNQSLILEFSVFDWLLGRILILFYMLSSDVLHVFDMQPAFILELFSFEITLYSHAWILIDYNISFFFLSSYNFFPVTKYLKLESWIFLDLKNFKRILLNR